LLAQTYLACQSPIPGIDIHACQLYSSVITIPIPHFIPQRAFQSKLQRIQVISASESGVIISKKREGRRREDHSPSLKSCKLWSSNKSEKEAIYFISSYLPNIPCSMKSEFG